MIKVIVNDENDTVLDMFKIYEDVSDRGLGDNQLSNNLRSYIDQQFYTEDDE